MLTKSISIAQQTDKLRPTTSRNIKKVLCKGVKNWGCYVFGIIFVTSALVFAVIYQGRKANHLKRWRNYRNEKLDTYFIYDLKVTPSDINLYPSVGSLSLKKPHIFLCTVVLIDKIHVLTTPECVTFPPDNLLVRVGSDFWNKGGLVYGIESYEKDNFLALAKLNETTQVETTAPSENFTFDEFTEMVGWIQDPFDDTNNSRTVDCLVKQSFKIWQPNTCRRFVRDDNNYFCASSNASQCVTGLIGPLFVKQTLVGLWYWGLSCPTVPSIFTNISHHLYWIKREIAR